jgi:HK97 family phage major capsid protein
MSREKTLLDKRAATWAACTEIMERARTENRSMSAEERTAYERGATEVESLTAEIDLERRHAKLDSSFAEIDTRAREDARSLPPGSPEAIANGEEYRGVFARYLRGDRLSMEDAGVLQRAQVTGTNNVGGFLVPVSMHSKISETMRTFGGLLDVIDLFTTDSGESYKVPTNDDTFEGTIVGETPAEADHNNTAANNASEDTIFGQVTLNAFWYSSRRVLVSYGLIQDSAYDVESYVARKVGERLGRVVGRHATNGTGTNQPQGAVAGAAAGVTAAAATSISWRDLVGLQHSVDAAYRLNGRFMMNDAIVRALRLEQDTTNRPIWQPSTQPGQPDTLLGSPYTVNNFMLGTMAATNKTVLYGDFREAIMGRQAGQSLLMILREKYAEQFMVGYLGYRRFDSRVVQPSAVKVLVH